METTTQTTSANTSATAVTIGLRFGLLIGMISMLADFVMRLIRPNVLVYSIITGIIALAITITGIILAHRAFRRTNSGLMTYGQGVLITLVAIMVSAMISTLFNYVYVHYIDSNFVAQLKADMTDFMERNNAPSNQIEQSVAKFDEMQPSLGKALFNGLKSGVIGGVVLGLIISAFTKRKPVDFD